MHLIKLLKLSAGWLTASKLAPGNITFVLLKIIEFVIKFIKYAQGEHNGENCLHTELYDIINWLMVFPLIQESMWYKCDVTFI